MFQVFYTKDIVKTVKYFSVNIINGKIMELLYFMLECRLCRFKYLQFK